VDDDALTDAWEAGLDRPIGHVEHLRIARVLLLRHGAEAGGRRVVAATRRNCELHGAAESFDEELTLRWCQELAALLVRAPSFEELVARRPELLQGDLFGRPG
jgi:hypothetical protein